MHLVVCPHCWRQLKLARSGAEFPAGPVCCRYCGAVFAAEVLEVPDDQPLPLAHEVYEHLRVEYDSSHLYDKIPAAVADKEHAAVEPADVDEVEEISNSDQLADQVQAAQRSVEDISRIASQSQADEVPTPEFTDEQQAQTGEKKIAARAAGHSHDDGEIEIDEPRIAKRTASQEAAAEPEPDIKPQAESEMPSPAAVPADQEVEAKTKPDAETPQHEPAEPEVIAPPQVKQDIPAKVEEIKPVPVEPVKADVKPQPEKAPAQQQTKAAEPVKATAPQVTAQPKPEKKNSSRMVMPRYATNASLKKDDVQVVAPAEPQAAMPTKTTTPNESNTPSIKPGRSWPIKAAVFLLVAGCIYAIYAGAVAVLDRSGNTDMQAKITADPQQQAKQKIETLLAADDDIELIEDATVFDLEDMAATATDGPKGFTSKFVNTQASSLDIARVELTFTTADGRKVTLKSDQYRNIPAGSEIMFSVLADGELPQESELTDKVVKGAKAAPDAAGWNISDFSRKDSDGRINIFGQTQNNTENTLKNIYIWCDFFTSDGLFAGSAKGTLPADAVELRPGSKVSYSINFQIDQSSAAVPRGVEFARPRLMGTKVN